MPPNKNPVSDYFSGNRCRIKNAHIIMKSVLITIGCLYTAGYIQDHVKNLLPHICNGFLSLQLSIS